MCVCECVRELWEDNISVYFVGLMAACVICDLSHMLLDWTILVLSICACVCVCVSLHVGVCEMSARV